MTNRTIEVSAEAQTTGTLHVMFDPNEATAAQLRAFPKRLSAARAA
jgi:hypothetical protein